MIVCAHNRIVNTMVPADRSQMDNVKIVNHKHVVVFPCARDDRESFAREVIYIIIMCNNIF